MPKYQSRPIAERSAPSHATALHIFDFDDTLYDSPRQPKSWEGTEREWWRSPASLSPPHLPAGTERQRALPTVQVAKASIRNPKVHAILLSGRADDPGMRMRMEAVLKTLGLAFDGIYLKDSGNTEQYKARIVENLLQQMPSVQTVAMWDDLARNLNTVEKVAAAEGLGFQRNLIRTSYSFAEQRQACFDATNAKRHDNSPESSPNLSERTMSFFADFKRLAHGRQLPTLAEAVAPVLTEEDDQIGLTIVKQMGGAGKLKMMIGAKLLLMPKGLKITFPNRLRSKGNSVVITLEPSDTYKMEFFNGAKSVKVYDDVYADKLKEIFETQTGLYLSL